MHDKLFLSCILHTLAFCSLGQDGLGIQLVLIVTLYGMEVSFLKTCFWFQFQFQLQHAAQCTTNHATMLPAVACGVVLNSQRELEAETEAAI